MVFVAIVRETHPALWALVRLLARVNDHMLLQMSLVDETSRAELTLELLQRVWSVNHHFVVLDFGGIPKHFSANITGCRLGEESLSGSPGFPIRSCALPGPTLELATVPQMPQDRVGVAENLPTFITRCGLFTVLIFHVSL